MTHRELDQQVAERVMGWIHYAGLAIPAKHREIAGQYNALEDQEVWLLNDRRMACKHCGTLPAFSTDPAAMLQVVERMREQGWTVSLTGYRKTERPEWIATMHPPGNDPMRLICESGGTPGEVVCRAALTALGGRE